MEGPAEMITAAKKDIEENLTCKTNFFIEKDCVGLVIGRKGEKIHAMEDKPNVRIKVNKDNGEVVVTGKRREEAKKAIEANLSCVTEGFPYLFPQVQSGIKPGTPRV